MIAIFTFIFAGIFGVRFGVSDSHWDYALYLFCGLLPWTMFQESVQQSANTIITHANLVKRVVFPLETLPAAQAFAALGNQLFATVGLLIAVLAIQRELATDDTVAAGAVDSAVVVCARRGVADRVARSVSARHRAGVTLLLMAWMYLTPIIYPESIVPDRFRTLINLNPFTPLVRSYRRVFLEGVAP